MDATVTLSIEIELGWGTHDFGGAPYLSDGAGDERRYLRRLLDVCDRLDVPITFNIVGHLLLDSCGGHHAGPYPDGWFDADPGTDVATDPAFYAPDVARDVLASPAGHELATHTFSHVPGGQFDDGVVAADIARAVRTHEEVLGERPVAAVAPRHYRLPADALRDNGIEVVRYSRGTYDGGPLSRYRELLLDDFPPDDPALVDGVLETYVTGHTSLTAPTLPGGQRDTHPAYRVIPTRVRQRLHRRRLERMTRRAVRDGDSLHLWTHLWNLSNESQFPVVEGYLETLATHRDAGDLDVLTMGELNDRYRSCVSAAPDRAEVVGR